jgi:hypothetical protein
VLLFLVDLIMPLVMGPDYAPFRGASWIMDLCMVIAGGMLGYISWTTYRDQD